MGGCLSSEFPGALSFLVLSHAALQWLGIAEHLGLRNKQVFEKPIDENSGMLVRRSAANE